MYPRLLPLYGPFAIQSYGSCIALGFVLFLFFSSDHSLREELMSKELYLSILFNGLIFAIAGGRLLFVWHQFDYFKEHWPEIFYLWEGGFASQGALLGLAFFVPIYLIYKKIALLKFIDLIALHAPLIHAVGRIGCFLAGCCYGCPAQANALFSVTFVHAEGCAPCFVPLVPLQLYLFFVYLALYFLLKKSSLYLLRFSGCIAMLYLFSESSIRFFSDFWRGDRELLTGQFLSATQINALIIMMIAVFLFFSLLFMYRFCFDSVTHAKD